MIGIDTPMLNAFRKLLSGKPDAGQTSAGADPAPVPAIPPPVGPVENTVELSGAGKPGEKGWIGVDLDGTLAYYDGWKGFGHIGPVVEPIKARVLEWIAQGYRVKIFTARASAPEGIEPIRKWLLASGLPELEITCQKDFNLIEVWDDRAIQVVHNTGSPVLSARWAAQPRAPLFGLERSLPPAPRPAAAPAPQSDDSGE